MQVFDKNESDTMHILTTGSEKCHVPVTLAVRAAGDVSAVTQLTNKGSCSHSCHYPIMYPDLQVLTSG